jgi:PhzF family phenazine biosynthesis protein
MQAIYYHVDAFTERVFGGNSAGVCPLNGWLPDETLQQIAGENNLSETAFFVRQSNGQYDLRWFTPVVEIDLCGHATLASAHVLWKHEGENSKTLTFQTKSGPLTVTREENDLLALNFPNRPAAEIAEPEGLLRAFGLSGAPAWIGQAQDRFLVVLKSRREVLDAAPNFSLLAGFSPGRFILSAPGENGIDFVSRYFAPDAGVPEDPVTGSAHCTLIPYWAERLGKTVLRARQISKRGGDLFCELLGERVKIAGRAVTYSRGMIDF